MSFGSPPLRFLFAVVGGWAAMRWAMLAPAGPVDDDAAIRPGASAPAPTWPADPPARAASGTRFAGSRPVRRAPPLGRETLPEPQVMPPAMAGLGASPGEVGGPAAVPPQAFAATAPRRRQGRWSASAWALVRRGEPGALATGGTLGGSQIGGRLVYRLAPPLSLSARLSAPATRLRGAEAALGIEWTPVPRIPVRLLAERRQALGPDGRSAFALLAHGGADDRKVAGSLRLDAYLQAGIVGLRSREPFADGSVRLTLPLGDNGRFRLGAGAWAAAQRGIARLDAGPHAALRLPGVTVALDWRLRLGGDAAPRSGPALTLATDF